MARPYPAQLPCFLPRHPSKQATPQSNSKRGALELSAPRRLETATGQQRHQHALNTTAFIYPIPNRTPTLPGMAEPAPVGREVIYCGGEFGTACPAPVTSPPQTPLTSACIQCAVSRPRYRIQDPYHTYRTLPWNYSPDTSNPPSTVNTAAPQRSARNG